MDYLYKGLVHKAKKGSKSAMEELGTKLKPLIYSAIRRYKGEWDPEDLYQDAWVILLEALRDFDEERGVPFLGFIKSRIYYGIHNLTRNNLNMLSLDEPLWDEDGQSMLDKLIDPDEGVEDSVTREELYKTLRECIDSLTPKQGEVIIAHYFEGRKLKDIARHRGIHYKAVLRLKDRAIKELNLRLGSLR